MSTLMEFTLHDKPAQLPGVRPDGHELKTIPQVVLDRRATPHFLPDPIPANYLDAILQIASQAPSGFNLQPWRFIDVQDLENRRRLQKAAYNQAKIAEAPAVIIFLGMKQETKDRAHDILAEGARRGAGNPANVDAATQGAMNLLNSMPMPVWVNRHVMIAFTTMMLAAESYGFDTAPMEGFDPAAVKREFNIPDDAEVVALLAIGRLNPPDKPYPGRYALDQIACSETYGHPWHS